MYYVSATVREIKCIAILTYISLNISVYFYVRIKFSLLPDYRIHSSAIICGYFNCFLSRLYTHFNSNQVWLNLAW